MEAIDESDEIAYPGQVQADRRNRAQDIREHNEDLVRAGNHATEPRRHLHGRDCICTECRLAGLTHEHDALQRKYHNQDAYIRELCRTNEALHAHIDDLRGWCVGVREHMDIDFRLTQTKLLRQEREIAALSSASGNAITSDMRAPARECRDLPVLAARSSEQALKTIDRTIRHVPESPGPESGMWIYNEGGRMQQASFQGPDAARPDQRDRGVHLHPTIPDSEPVNDTSRSSTAGHEGNLYVARSSGGQPPPDYEESPP